MEFFDLHKKADEYLPFGGCQSRPVEEEIICFSCGSVAHFKKSCRNCCMRGKVTVLVGYRSHDIIVEDSEEFCKHCGIVFSYISQ
jgi:hypothetical protein